MLSNDLTAQQGEQDAVIDPTAQREAYKMLFLLTSQYNKENT